MGCKWPKIGATYKASPVNESTNQSVPVLNDVVIGQQNTESLDVTLRQPISNITDYSRQSNEHAVVDESIEQSIPISVENSKPLSSDESTNHEVFGLIHNATNYPTSTFIDNSMQTFEQMSTHETTNKYLLQRNNSGTLNKRSISENNQQQQTDHRSEKSNDEIISVSNKSIEEENIDDIPDTTNDQTNKKIDGSIEETTITGKVNR